jgi:RHS repeat-associated protein
LPQSITYSTNKSATYTYDAAGRKLKVIYTNPSLTIDYCGNMIYEGGTLKQIQVDGGYVTFSGTTPVYHYYLQDHQGNNRVVVNKPGTVEEVNHYYPFGLLFGESVNPDTQRFKYNGKELDMMHGLHMYDYGARQYDPLLCRFTTMDPMCEKYYHLSPYAYCGNNPINMVDVRGDTISYTNQGVQYYYRMDGNNSGFYTKQGVRLERPFEKALTNALKTIHSGQEGNKLISYLTSSTAKVNIFSSNDENATTFKNGNINVFWNPDDPEAAGVDQFGGIKSPTFVSLSHELFHAKDYAQYGASNQKIWFVTPQKVVRMSEYYTSINENLIRAEHALPLREYYSSYEKSKRGYPPSRIPIYGIYPTRVWGNSNFINKM